MYRTVLYVNTVPDIDILLVQYWRGILWQYWWNSDVGISLTVSTLLVYYWFTLVQYWLPLLAKYRQRRYANFRHSIGREQAVYNIQIQNMNQHGSLVDSWHSTGLLMLLISYSCGNYIYTVLWITVRFTVFFSWSNYFIVTVTAFAAANL